MKKIVITSTRFNGEVAAVYDADEVLHSISFADCDANASQRKGLKEFIPVRLAGFNAEGFVIPDGVMIASSDYEISFEEWYEKFGKKRNKIPANKLWDKLSKAKKIKCATRTPAYLKHLKKNTWLQQMYPDTWIRGEHWEDEWETL